jgi:transposase InsO family protein
VHEDLLQRRFVAEAPDRLWCTDITEHPTGEGKVYCAAVLDVYSRRIVGWSIADHMRSELVVDALQMARWNRQPAAGTILHSDRGAQGEFNRLSQHLVTTEVFDGSSTTGGRSCDAAGYEIAGASTAAA